MAKKNVDYGSSLERLDKLGRDNATAIAGDAPLSLDARLKAASKLEETGGKAPLRKVVAAQAGEDTMGYVEYQEGMAVRPGDRLIVRIQQIKPNSMNPRFFYLEADIRDRSVSLAAEGQLQAVQAYAPDETGVFELHDGETRVRGISILGQETALLEIVQRDPNPLTRFRQARALNTQRKTQTIFDDAVRFTDLVKQRLVKGNTELASVFGLQPAHVSKLMSIGELPRSVLERMAEHAELFGLANAYAVYQYWKGCAKDLHATDGLVSKVIDGKLSVRALQQLIESQGRAAAPTARKRERPLSRAEIKTGGKGELKAFPDGKIQLELREVPEANRALLYNRILALFDECGVGYDAVATA